MRNLRCIIVDDEPLAVSMIESFVQRTPGIDMLDSFNDPVMALSRIRETVPDIVFLDIQMPDLNGLELSRMLPEQTKVIFTTAFKEYALEGFEVAAIDFLLKPIRYQKFLEAVQKAKFWFELKEAASNAGSQAVDSIYVKVEKVLQKVMLSDILFIVGMKDYVMIHTASSKNPIMTHITMKGIEQMLPPDKFMRVHRSYIIALDKIDSVQPGMDVMIGKTFIHVSDAYKDDFETFLKKRAQL